MPLRWNLRLYLANHHGIFRATELQVLLKEKAGVHLSLQSVSTLMKDSPSAMRVQTIQAICNALGCKLSDFCEVLPDKEHMIRQRKVAGGDTLRLYGGKETNEDSEDPFPHPRNYRKTAKD